MTINLERELIKQNKSIVTAKELLVMREYEKLGSIPNSKEVLERLGMASSIHKAENIVKKRKDTSDQLAKFNSERVFHISQIKSICNKYYLRFLPSSLYNGSVDADLANKVLTFEVAYGLDLKNTHYYIMAPASSFKLEAKPKDPLFFYHIADGYYYLVHKWGNDLSMYRRLLPLLSNRAVNLIVFYALFILMESLLPFSKDWATQVVLKYTLFPFIFLVVLSLVRWVVLNDDCWCRLIKKNNPFSQTV